MNVITRKQFLERSAAGSLLLLLQSCGGGGGSSSGPGFGSAPCGASGAAISANHGHILFVQAADLSSTTPKTYSIVGTAGHDHSVTLSVVQLTALKTAGATVTVTSTPTTAAPYGAHTHDVTVSCV